MTRILALLASLAATGQGFAQDIVRTPAEMARLLQDAQGQVALGVAGGPETLAGLLAAMGEKFAHVEAAVWREPRHARAAALFVFSGGDASVARLILDRGGLAAPEASLLRGALAHVEGRAAEARKLIADLDPRGFESALGGHLAFAQAGMAKDGAAARGLLELARLLAPGGLVEEAALRREIFLAGESGDAAAFAELSRRYARRFRASAYFDNFAQRFVAAAAALPLGALEAALPALEDATRGLEAKERRAFLLSLARRALIEGRRDIGRRAAREALAIAGDDALARRRAQLYAAAADIAPGVAAEPDLSAVGDEGLDAQDRALRAAALVAARASTRAVSPPGDAPAVVGAEIERTAAQARRLLEETATLAQAGRP